jgi:hypothetical protein
MRPVQNKKLTLFWAVLAMRAVLLLLGATQPFENMSASGSITRFVITATSLIKGSCGAACPIHLSSRAFARLDVP